MTGILFFSGTNLLSLVDQSDILSGLTGGGAAEADDSGTLDSNMQIGVSGISFFKPVDADSINSFVDVLRGFKQNTGDPINILLLASDAGDANTDSILVVHFDPKTSQINILSIPRDTYVTVSGLKIHKINGVFGTTNGPDRIKAALREMLGQPIDYYVRFDLKTVREIVDLLGGVEYDVPCDMIYDDPDQNLHINIKKGLRTLTGKQVEGLLRFRHPNKWTKEVQKYYDGSDIKRIERLQDFISAMLKQKVTIQYAPQVADVITTVYANIKTDLPLSEMLKLAKALPSLSPEKFQTATLPGDAKTIDSLSYYVHSAKQTQALAEALLSDVPPPAVAASAASAADGTDDAGGA
jgi:LCP family protein required for cell wall assembly